VLGSGAAKDVTLEGDVFGAEVKPHLLHETVRAELNARRAGTIRAAQFTGGGVVFPPGMRSFEVKVNRKARRAALRGALSHHAANGTLGILGGDAFAEPSTKSARALVDDWGKETPLLVVTTEGETALVKSFRNLPRVLVTVPEELEVASIVWARSVLISVDAIPLVQGRAGA
jgi:large subunit ribosomal protein L4